MFKDHIEVISFLRRALWSVLAISIAGIAFSGTLAYRELSARVAACPAVGGSCAILGIPTCVYGLVMYAFLALIAGLALVRTSSTNAGLAEPGPIAG